MLRTAQSGRVEKRATKLRGQREQAGAVNSPLLGGPVALDALSSRLGLAAGSSWRRWLLLLRLLFAVVLQQKAQQSETGRACPVVRAGSKMQNSAAHLQAQHGTNDSSSKQKRTLKSTNSPERMFHGLPPAFTCQTNIRSGMNRARSRQQTNRTSNPGQQRRSKERVEARL
jgi:hypothetical protein